MERARERRCHRLLEAAAHDDADVFGANLVGLGLSRRQKLEAIEWDRAAVRNWARDERRDRDQAAGAAEGGEVQAAVLVSAEDLPPRLDPGRRQHDLVLLAVAEQLEPLAAQVFDRLLVGRRGER
jgi:hypothetical protein